MYIESGAKWHTKKVHEHILTDTKFLQNVTNCRENGLKYGVLSTYLNAIVLKKKNVTELFIFVTKRLAAASIKIFLL